MESILTLNDLQFIEAKLLAWLAKYPRLQSVSVAIDEIAEQIWLEPQPIPSDKKEASKSYLELMDALQREFPGTGVIAVMESLNSSDLQLGDPVMVVQSPLHSAPPEMALVEVPKGT